MPQRIKCPNGHPTKRPPPTYAAPRDPPRRVWPLAAAAVALCSVAYMLWKQRQVDVLLHVASGHFFWDAAGAVPTSVVSVLLRRLLSDNSSLPSSLLQAADAQTIPAQPVRRWLAARRLERLKALCAERLCNASRLGPHGTTALHVALATGDQPLATYLRQLGAVDAPDDAGRVPHDLELAGFIDNAKQAAADRGDSLCQLPAVQYDGGDEATRAAARLITEGKPALLRGALYVVAPDLMQGTADDLLAQRGNTTVAVGTDAFNLSTTTRLADFRRQHMTDSTAGAGAARLQAVAKDEALCGALERLVARAFPRDLFVPPAHAADCHFSLGAARSGAPHRLHADAATAAVRGRRRWFVYTPRRALHSRIPAAHWTQHVLPTLPDDERPLQCLQRPGDVLYVPLDWGRAVLNEDDALAVELQLLNRRDTFLDIAGRRPPVLQ